MGKGYPNNEENQAYNELLAPMMNLKVCTMISFA